MVAFPCPCGQKLKVADTLAGKSVKCPKCGQVVRVPGLQPASGAGGAATQELPSAPGRGGPNANPTRSSAPSGESDETLGEAKGPAGADPLTAFLAPRQSADELGRLGGYRVLKMLGHGGMGVVFQAEDPQLRRKVAIKAMLPDIAGSVTARQRFLREAQAAAALEHDHIVPILHVGEERGAPYIVMPFLKGESLEDRLKRGEPIPLVLLLQIGMQVAEGLEAAHAQGLLHRDIKPANIWLESKERVSAADLRQAVQASDAKTTSWSGSGAQGVRVKLLDFGLARLTQAENAEHLTQTGAILGTPGYMAPEQINSQELDGRADLFSLGCVLYRLATGRPAFPGETVTARILAVAKDTPAAPSAVNREIPAALSELIVELLAKRGEERPKSATEVVGRLQEISREAEVGSDSARDVRVPKPRHGGRGPWIAVGTASTGLLAALAALVLWWPAPQRTEVQDGGLVAKELPAAFTNRIGMEFVLVPKGKFFMGGGGGTVGAKEVEVPDDFYLGKYEVTQEEWLKVMKGNPSEFSISGLSRRAVANLDDRELARFPVDSVSWNDCQEFMARLNEAEKAKGWKYSLPTAAQWEYACRGGPAENKRDYGWDYYVDRLTNTLAPVRANFVDTGLKRTCKVGSYQPNRLGLYDMHGNVREWCADEAKDANGASQRVNRGGSWYYDSTICRAAFRNTDKPSHRVSNLGLRLARVPVGKEIAKVDAPEEKKPPLEAKSADAKTFTNRIGMEFVLVPKGKFFMGGGGGTVGAKEVEVPDDFYLGKYEVTQEEWLKVMKLNPSAFSISGTHKNEVANLDARELARFPVEMVSWDDCQEFVMRLSEAEKAKGWKYSLPTEAQWEYACRGGPVEDKRDYGWDYYVDRLTNTLDPDRANVKASGLNRTCKVGSYLPNRLGLYDMHGNVREWCADETKDAMGASQRVSRGGSWSHFTVNCRAADRFAREPSYRYFSYGLRLARVPVGGEVK